ncbi:restriction endonuclease subunit S domain-containing protein [Weissella fangxianensis]|uniref:hypothetical protein n=1 Tax=Weissella fangxianensis TaxID=2953879 RepID=UPI002157632D|nr:hypothetical protein [Weissella fangxianensis]
MARFNEETTFEEVLDTPEGTEIARKHLGNLLDRPSVGMMKNKPLGELRNMIPLPPIKKKFSAMIDELCELD